MRAGPLRVALCCQVRAERPRSFLRCLALAEELLSRDIEVIFVADLSASSWAAAQLEARGIESEPPPDAGEYGGLLDRRGVSAVVVDPAGDLRSLCAVAREAGRATLAVVDGGSGDVEADIVVDPCLEARERRAPSGAPEASTGVSLTGADYALLRNDVLANRRIAPQRRREPEVPEVLVALDGPDVGRGCEAVVRMLVESGAPFDAVVAAAAPGLGERLAAVPSRPGQRVRALTPGPRLHERAARSSVVISTASDRTYEWLALGSALGLVWAVEEEVELYRRLMVRRAVVGLGSVAGLDDDVEAAAEKTKRLLLDVDERGRLAETAWRLVDGLGRARIVDVLLQHLQ
jgi:spore coat polysaccharide biosynthesis predicted glycosyltransferase SpsG